MRAGNYTHAIPLLDCAFQAGWEPGESAVLLAICYQRLQPSPSDVAKSFNKWKKVALHRGFKLEDAPKLLD